MKMFFKIIIENIKELGLIGLTFSLITGCATDNHLGVSRLFNDNMVIQRNQPIKVWGMVNDGAKVVRLHFNNAEYETISVEGKWLVELPEMPAGGPYEMSIISGSNQIFVKNILIGDVWICSGQSNMEWSVKDAKNARIKLSRVNDTLIRHFKVPRSGSDSPSSQLIGGYWEVSNGTSVADFTAVGYYFAKELRKDINVPIGLLNATWGGSRIESWINPELLKHEGRSKEEQIAIDSANARFTNNLKNLKNNFPEVTNKDGGITNGKAIWSDPDLDTKDWGEIIVPSVWENAGFSGLDGVGWYRTEFELNKDEVHEPIKLGLGKIDDCDRSFVNGVEIGGYCDWELERVYVIDPKIIKVGKNTITIRVEDGGGGGGIAGDESMLFVKTKKETISLAHKWKFKVGATVNMSFAGMYNKMIHPLTKFPIKGVIWYQGESNTNTINEAIEYEHLFKELINNWRHQWNQGDFPFLFVQLANFASTGVTPNNWAILRDSQSKALELDHVGQAITIDIGDPNKVHPKNKQDVGKRLALAAQKIAYGKDITYSGPTYKAHRIQENKIIIEFNNIGSGLISKNNKNNWIGEFEIAGDDKLFKPSKAILKGNSVVVVCESVKNPKFIRYAWSDNPENINLYNKEGLPASPFNTNLQESLPELSL